MGFKISPRAIGFSAGLQLPFSIILALRSRAESRTIRARRNNPGGLFRCFVRGRAKAAPEMRIPTRRADYRLGSLYSLLTAVLVATQEPFSALAARRLSSSYFIFLTQFALLLSVPLLTLPRSSRRDFIRLMANIRNLSRLAILFIFGLCGLLLYYVGLSSAHPIITATIFNLSPFWAALVAMAISRKPIPVSPHVFFGSFAVAFAGAMTVAWSQLDNTNGRLVSEIIESMLHSRWSYAIPIPIFFALSGSLVGKWFSDFDESAAIAANFVVSSFILIPSILLTSRFRPAFSIDEHTLPAILLLLLGTLAAAAAGRVFYQVALTTTDNDNGFVTMFFLLIPALSALITVPLSWWIPELRFVISPMFYIGLGLVTVSLLFFLLRSWGNSPSP
jgi:drug/metabolite transporter (DMT)-like permease